ncbi:DEAD/DEAH box helicase [Deinococcus sp. AJ005]|uniref:DEAD/DEAH box helicase n=1 Tax=Deinococcus sp. AJ005 TaxID=2652443 RepID=UPI00125CAB25|nr:AAA domain-containing protein [Deinococcus sp. AJ005]QFP75009.1 AAA family ATPase [Deinococcus sp. AJ005]
MRAHEVSAGHTQVYTLERLTGEGQLSKQDEVQLRYSEAMDEFLVVAEGSRWTVRGSDGPGQALQLMVARGLPHLAWVASLQDRQLTVQVHTFPLGYQLPEPRVIGVDEVIIDRMRQFAGTRLQEQDVVDLLTRDLTLPVLPGGTIRFLYAGAPNRHPEREKALRLIGKRWNLDVVEHDGVWLASRITEQKGKRSQRLPVTLLEAPWTFQSVTVAARDREWLRNQNLSQALDNQSYLHLWEQYQNIERERSLRRARELGALLYARRPEYRAGIWRFHVQATPEQFGLLRQGGNLTLQVAAERPAHLQEGQEPVTGTTRGRIQEFLAEFVRADEAAGILDLRPLDREESEPPPAGYVAVSLLGDRMQFERRDRARQAIVMADTPMPQLAALLEGLEVPQRRLQRQPALTRSSQADAAFRGTPTTRQIEALDIALNTPDIALIQGPPGTGKTRVIAALQQRLAELSPDPGKLAGQTLLTSAQHAAVENAASATVVFGLPAVKVGRNRRVREEFSDAVEHWRQRTVTQLRAQLADQNTLPLEVRYARLRDAVLSVTTAPSSRDRINAIIREILEVGGEHLKPGTRDGLRELLDNHEVSAAPVEQDLDFMRAAVRGLRTEEASFLDDGTIAARRVLRRLDGALLPPESAALLAQAASWDHPSAPPFLPQLAELKQTLLAQLQPQLASRGPLQVGGEVETALNLALGDLRAEARKQAGGPETVLHDLLDALENDPHGTREAVKNYTVVLAATCQQSASQAVREIRTSLGSQTRVFENVIIDEAARVHPLDLLIPMAQAERRIVLVGDHRQLPHLLEPDVEREFQQSVEGAQQEALHQSLFERLFKILQEREQRDGIRRVITLDQQYRMHPVLGTFVSDTFYAAHNAREAFGNGRPAEDFVHDLPDYQQAVAAWLDVPHALGAERGRQSKCRPVEAREVAREAHRILNARPDLSVGVISFYAEQVREIYRQMEGLGLTQRGEENELTIHADYRETYGPDGRPQERLRVGTVDAFQGMEFDVVLLSATRSNVLPATTPAQQRRRYGHLTLENRLCVAMSRQQRLLIVVGDAGMLCAPGEDSAVPALDRFYTLCKGPHGRIFSH